MKNFLKNSAVQSLIASLLCIVLGLLIGYVVLLFINPSGAGDAIMAVIRNFFNYSRANLQLKNFGNTLVKTAPLLMCALSVLFAYKVGLFNIGAAGQYVIGACASIYAALAWGWSWLPCLLFAIVAGADLGAVVGFLKSYLNVNEVISGIMLNWIGLYLTNMLLTTVKEATSPYTFHIASANPSAILPSLGLGKLFAGNGYVSLAIPLSILLAIAIAVILDRTKFGYELKATGNNKNAAKYCGMAERRNIILTLVISGALAGRAVAVHDLVRAEHGLQRHRGYLPRRAEPHRHHLLVLLHPAHHLGRRLCRQDHVLVSDLGSDLRHHHLSLRFRSLHQVCHQCRHCQT